MKKLTILIVGLSWLALHDGAAAISPQGRLLELHSCQVYAGGCVVSSEATLGGRYMLRVWDFTQGDYAGANFAGLQLAVLQTSPENLAERSAEPADTVVYLPESASACQRASLVAWLKANEPEIKSAELRTRLVPMHFTREGLSTAFTAGDYVSLTVAPLESCRLGGCGEKLWYNPRTLASVFTVGVNTHSQVREPWLRLKWDDGGKPTVFLARFGVPTPAQNLYVSTADFCATSGTLF
jgi:hypothetical protein